jgi:trimeric autotransporter adhesin
MDEIQAFQLETLSAELEGLQVICAQLVRDNAELRDRLESLTSLAKGTPRAPAPSSGNVMTRRGMMTKALGAAAVTVVGGAALVNRDALPAAASNGSNVIAGGQTTAEARTSVLYDGAAGFGGVVLLGNDSTYSGTSAGFPAALGGWAGAGSTAGKGGVANGVYGFTDNGNGNGVVGVNGGLVAGPGAGVLGTANGAKNIAVQGHNAQGTAVSGTSDSTDSDATAIVGVISSSTPGAFSSAIRGQNNGTVALGIGVWGSHAGSGWGMYATSVSGIGLNVSGGTGTGVQANGATAVSASGTVGVASAGVTAVTANGSTVGVAAKGPTAVSATGANIGINASGATAVQAVGTAVGVAASGPTGVTAIGATTGVAASGPTGVAADGTTVGVTANGPTGVAATGTTTGVTASGPTALVATGTTVGVSASALTGIAVTGTGPLGRAIVAGTTSKAATVVVTNTGTGPALRATTGSGSGASGTGCVVGDSHEATGVLGLSNGGDGVRGHSKAGRGGNFAGGAAQIKLTPGSLASHPVPGETGDIYCDKTGRLWFCKKGSSNAGWKLIA